MNPMSASLKVYPNPAGNTLFISSSAILNGTLVLLTTAEGREIRQLHCNGTLTQIDLTGIARGVYFLIIESSEGRSVFRVIKE
jgi:hypothetical protein